MQEAGGYRAIVVLVGDLSNHGLHLGYETAARCELAVAEYNSTPSRIILMAGICDTNEYHSQKETASALMKKYMVNRGITEGHITTTSNPKVWGADQEIEKSLHWIFLRSDVFGKRNSSGRCIEVLLVSSETLRRRHKLLVDRCVKNFSAEGVHWDFSFLGTKSERRDRRIETLIFPFLWLKERVFGRK